VAAGEEDDVAAALDLHPAIAFIGAAKQGHRTAGGIRARASQPARRAPAVVGRGEDLAAPP